MRSFFLIFPAVLCGSTAENEVNRIIRMPDLGQGLRLGYLWDAIRGEPVDGSLWPFDVLDQGRYVQRTNAQNAMYQFVHGDSFEDKAKLTGLEGEMKLNFMSGSVQVNGAARFMQDHRRTSMVSRMSTSFQIRSFTETIDVFNPKLKDRMHPAVIAQKRATHVVTSVTWGADCIATLEKESKSIRERDLTDAFLQEHINMCHWDGDRPLQFLDDDSFQSSWDGVTVHLYGDVLPPSNESLPTQPAEALAFMRKLHNHAVGDDGVPKDIVLTPIAWIDDAAAKLQRAIRADTIQRAETIYMEMDTAEELVRDLLEIQPHAFRIWEWEQKAYLADLVAYRENYTAHLADAIVAYRSDINTTYLTTLFDEYAGAKFSLARVEQYTEEKKSEILNLKALVRPMQEDVGVSVASKPSDYTVPTLDHKFDKVKVLALAGRNPTADRASLEVVPHFTALARSHLSSMRDGDGNAVFCVEAMVEGRRVCVERLAFILIHFDSFCEQFCPSEFCDPEPFECTNYTSSRSLDPVRDRDEWCQNPCTTVLEFEHQVGDRPSINAISGAGEVQVSPQKITLHIPAVGSSVGNFAEVEAHPLHQKVTLQMSSVGNNFRNYQVRVIWYEVIEGGGFLGWERHERFFTTRNSDTDIVVRDLVAGRRYMFAVAGDNGNGAGPYSDEFPQGGLQVAYNMATVIPQASQNTENAAPTWKRVEVMVVLSVEAQQRISSVVFRSNSSEEVFACRDLKGASTTAVNCTVPAAPHARRSLTTAWTVVVLDINGEEVAWGRFIHEPPSTLMCPMWEERRHLLCDLESFGRFECVESCEDCIAGEQSTSRFGNTCTSERCTSSQVWCPGEDGGLGLVGEDGQCLPGDSNRVCQEQCADDSSELSQDGKRICVLPCELELPDTVGFKCSSVLPGQSCNIDCAHGYDLQGNATTFHCPGANTRRAWTSGDQGFPQMPTCLLQRCSAGTVESNGASVNYAALANGEARDIGCPSTFAGNVQVFCFEGAVTALGSCSSTTTTTSTTTVTTAALEACGGMTIPGSTNWQQYSGLRGVYVDVDTAGCHFSSTPVYVSSLAGTTSHWTSTGSSEIYFVSPTSFRIYIRKDGLTPAIANQRMYSVNWLADSHGVSRAPLGFCSGHTPVSTTDWQQYSLSRGVYVDIDTSACGFSDTPVFVSSMAGTTSHWETTGSSEVYVPSPTGFRIYIRSSGLTPTVARQRSYHINWMAADPRSSVASSGVCAGHTPELGTSWHQYDSNGIYVDVDTSVCGFAETPVYSSSLAGLTSHWESRGSSDIYSPTPTGFRIYIFLPGITPTVARSRAYHINWMARRQ